MKTTTKLLVLGALGAGVYAALRGRRRAAQPQAQPAEGLDAFDLSDLDEPVIVTEEVIVITEGVPYQSPR